jgi:hypothetical protein
MCHQLCGSATRRIARENSTWWSSNPKVMDVNQQGFAYAYTSGTAQIWFKSASGNTFSPWTMTVVGWYQTEFNIPPPVY